jgi:hypothetical protein
MRTFSLRTALLLFTVAAFAESVAHAENDVAASLYGAFSGSTNGKWHGPESFQRRRHSP